ncbi:unnamed protein product [Linum trigynum]|uniref:Uncharacterized protein n=1 Tax=Linum trigynum TaxID=586398 RepID=A0AAV2DJF8_9ROSI
MQGGPMVEMVNKIDHDDDNSPPPPSLNNQRLSNESCRISCCTRIANDPFQAQMLLWIDHGSDASGVDTHSNFSSCGLKESTIPELLSIQCTLPLLVVTGGL